MRENGPWGIFFKYVQFSSCRYKEGREIDLSGVWISQESAIKLEMGKGVETVCKREITIIDHELYTVVEKPRYIIISHFSLLPECY